MATSMLDSFDTQMLDYHSDLDFSMHVSSTDSWFQDEAVMEHDGLPLHTDNVEVDMEPYDEGHNEYEMEDGSGHRETDGGHFLDVELAGPSSVTIVQTTDLEPRNDSPNPTHTSLDLTMPFSSSDPPYLAGQYSPSPQSSHTALPSHLNASPNNQITPAIDEVLTGAPPVEVVSGEHLTLRVSASERKNTAVTPEPDLEGIGSVPNNLDPHAVDEVQNSDVDEDGEVFPAEASCAGGGVVSSETDFETSLGQEGAAVEYDGSAGDPHEISEGVYIDPPPAVLLSFAAADPEINLFNTPSQVNAESSHTPGAIVLLAHLPTLYYEPIFSVFEALRQEEHLVTIPGLLDGELVFDAYDLHLTIREVNDAFLLYYSS